jgi:hypothetical protein
MYISWAPQHRQLPTERSIESVNLLHSSWAVLLVRPLLVTDLLKRGCQKAQLHIQPSIQISVDYQFKTGERSFCLMEMVPMMAALQQHSLLQ